MSVTITYQPSGLSFDDFYALDEQCFPEEPIGRDFSIPFEQSPFWLAESKGRPVGYGFLKVMPELAWIARIGVVPTERKKGIGGRLMDVMLQYCRDIPRRKVILYVRQDNEAAVHLYERKGFWVSEESFQYIVSTDQLLDEGDFRGYPSVEPIPITDVPKRRRPAFPDQWSHLAELHDPPKTYVFLFYLEGKEQVGYCRLSPGFPGCFPLELVSPARQLPGALASLRSYLLPEHEILRLTFADPEMAHACNTLGFTLNYSLYKMTEEL